MHARQQIVDNTVNIALQTPGHFGKLADAVVQILRGFESLVGNAVKTLGQRFDTVGQFDDTFGGIIIQHPYQTGKIINPFIQFFFDHRSLTHRQLGDFLKFGHLRTNRFRHGLGGCGAALFGINQLIHICPQKLGFPFKSGTAVNVGHSHPDQRQRQGCPGQKTAEFVRHHQKQI